MGYIFCKIWSLWRFSQLHSCMQRTRCISKWQMRAQNS